MILDYFVHIVEMKDVSLEIFIKYHVFGASNSRPKT
jgi:hypothetical protein